MGLCNLLTDVPELRIGHILSNRDNFSEYGQAGRIGNIQCPVLASDDQGHTPAVPDFLGSTSPTLAASCPRTSFLDRSTWAHQNLLDFGKIFEVAVHLGIRLSLPSEYNWRFLASSDYFAEPDNCSSAAAEQD